MLTMETLFWALIVVGAVATLAAAFQVWRRFGPVRRRVLAEDALKHLHTCEWRGQSATLDSLCGALRLSASTAVRLIAQLEKDGLLRSSAEGLRLTPEGERVAVAIVRAHRLWERYLVDEARMPLASVHAEAERREHQHNPASLDALEAALGYPATDPHGDPIPTARGELVRPASQPLTAWPLHTPARIMHLEDEPALLFAQIAAMGLRPGQTVQVLEANEKRLVLSDGDAIHTLAPIVAANIFVAGDGAERPANLKRLSALPVGQQATVHALSESLQGFTRRRLLDLGLTPGARVTAELPSMFRDPVAYRVRGTLIALRRDQAEQVLIETN
jgi:DtxR family Mn-dependent transcriptional regulator